MKSIENKEPQDSELELLVFKEGVGGHERIEYRKKKCRRQNTEAEGQVEGEIKPNLTNIDIKQHAHTHG